MRRRIGGFPIAIRAAGHTRTRVTPNGAGSPQIQINPLVEGNRVAVATGLPVTGHTRLHKQPLALVVVVGCHLVRQRGARTHDAHVRAEHVDELRQLVQAQLAKHLAYAGDTRVLRDLEHRAGLLIELFEVCQLLLGVHAHAAELQHLELAAVFAHAGLLEEHGALGVIDLHQDGNDDEQPAQQHQNRGAEREVENSLHKAIGNSVIGPRYGFVPKFRLQLLGALEAFTTTLLHIEIVDSAATHGLVAGRGFAGRRGFRHGHDVALFPASPRRFLCSCSFTGH